jgi:hypothetical protein
VQSGAGLIGGDLRRVLGDKALQFKVIVEGMLAFTMDWRFCLSEV